MQRAEERLRVTEGETVVMLFVFRNVLVDTASSTHFCEYV